MLFFFARVKKIGELQLVFIFSVLFFFGVPETSMFAPKNGWLEYDRFL